MRSEFGGVPRAGPRKINDGLANDAGRGAGKEQDSVGEVDGFVEIVRDEDDRGAGLLPNA